MKPMAGRRAGQLGKWVNCSVWWEVTCSWQMCSECVGRAACLWEWWQMTLVCCVLQEEHRAFVSDCDLFSTSRLWMECLGNVRFLPFCAACARGKSSCRTFTIQQVWCQDLSGPLQCLKDYRFQTSGRVLLKGSASLRCAVPKSFPQGGAPPYCGFSHFCHICPTGLWGEMGTEENDIKGNRGDIPVFLT